MECRILRLPAPRQAFRIREKGGSMAAEKAERLDFLTRMRIRELVLMGLITVTAVLANLPHEYVEDTLGVSHATLIAVLACAVLLGLFLYLKFFLFVAVVLLVAGYTPLAYAAAKGNLEMVELLLRNGADPTQVTREGDTPVELALRSGHGGIADVLKRARQAFETGGAPQPHPA